MVAAGLDCCQKFVRDIIDEEVGLVSVVAAGGTLSCFSPGPNEFLQKNLCLNEALRARLERLLGWRTEVLASRPSCSTY